MGASALFPAVEPVPGTIERSLSKSGVRLVIGTDEVGRGCLAGPVVAAAVALPVDLSIDGVNDSKKLSHRRRSSLVPTILEKATQTSVVEISAHEIDEINILQASLKAMRTAVLKVLSALSGDKSNAVVLVDGPHKLDDLPIQQSAVKQGDSVSMAIASASIIAKVHRDRLMTDLARTHPGYGVEKNMDYGTAAHIFALNELGVTVPPRRTIPPVRSRVPDIPGTSGIVS